MTKRSLVFIWVLSFITSTAFAQEFTLLLKWRHQFQFAGVYAALDQGFFQEAGLEVKLRTWSPGIFVGEELLKGEVDFVIGNTQLLIDYAQGGEILALATYFQRNPWGLFVAPDSGIQDPKDLRGRSIMSGEGNVELELLLKSSGLTLDDIQRVPQGYGLTPLVEGRIDALAGYMTDAPFLLGQEGFVPRLLRPRDYGIPSIGDSLYARKDLVNSRPEEVLAFVDALNMGWKYALDNPEELIELILSKYNPELSREFLEYEARQTYLAISPLDIDIGTLDQYRWQRLAEAYQNAGLIQEIDLDNFLYTREDYEEAGQRRTNLILILALVLLGIIIPISLYRYLPKKPTVSHKKKPPPEVLNDLLIEQVRYHLLGKLISPVIHDLNTPLSISLTAQGNIQERLDEIERSSPPELKESDFCQENLKALGELSVLQQQHLTRSIDLLGSYKRTASLEEVVQETFLSEVLDDIRKVYLKRLSRNNVILSWHVEPTLRAPLAPAVFSTLIVALLEYSISRFDPESGSYTCSLSAEVNQGALIIVYQDNGLFSEKDPWEKLQQTALGMDLGFILQNPIQFAILACLKKLGFTFTYTSGNTGFRLNLSLLK
jgi:ABC-type nitrate/sulfonate/bicarbonate transport system substrate-binding protein